MKNEVRSILKKTAKIAGVACVAAGAVALVSSKAALQAFLKGSEYVKDAVKKITEEKSADAPILDAEPVAAEQDFAGEVSEAVVLEVDAE